MPRGQVLNIPNGSAVTTVTLSHEEKASIAMLNPNDGVLYVKLNGPAYNTPTMWDWKVPSQSYCQLPGPWQSLGVFYQDQSGGGAAAQVNVYESDSQIAIPSFIAIGRAVQTAGTTMDISTGTQPQNPPATTVRLWADGNGDLHILSETGVDNIVYDSSNIANVTVGGDIYGSIGAAHIGILYNNHIDFHYSDGSFQRAFQPVNLSNYIFTGKNGVMYFWSDTPAANLGNWDANANLLRVEGGIKVVGQAYCNYVVSDSGVDVGAGPIYFAHNGGIHIDWNGTYIHFTHSITTDGSAIYFANNASIDWTWDGTHLSTHQPVISNSYIVAQGSLSANGGTIYLRNDNAITISWNGARIAFSHGIDIAGVTLTTATARGYGALMTGSGQGDFILGGGNSILYMHPNFSVGIQQNYPNFQVFGFVTLTGLQIFLPVDVAAGNGFMGPRRSGAPSNEVSARAHLYVDGSVWCTNVQYLSQRELKTNLDTLNPGEAIKLVGDGRVKSYRFEWLNPVEGSNPANTFSYGFMADEMVQVCPETVELSEIDNVEIPAAINYSQLVPVLWAAVRNLNDRISTLELTA